MSQIYSLIQFGLSPVSLADMKEFLKVTSTSEDTLIQALIDAATEFGEKYTGREFRDNAWNLLLDSFSDIGNSSERFQREHVNSTASFNETERIELKRDPVDSILSIAHLVNGIFIPLDISIFYLKKLTQSSEVLLSEGESWPTNTDDREQSIEIMFMTESYRCLNEIIQAIKLHVSHLYTNRGDCSDSVQAANNSGATLFYDQFRIARV